MKIVQLETFVVVAEELHFRRAAERLFMQPSSVSSQIAQLEAEYGTALFIRNSRNVTLSPAGHRLLDKAKSVLAGIDDLERTARALARGDELVLNVGALDEGLAELTQIVESNYGARFPNTDLNVASLDYDELADALEQGSVDVLTTTLAEARTWFGGLPTTVVDLFDEGRCVVLPVGHPLAGCSSLTTAEILSLDFLNVRGIPVDLQEFFMLNSRRDPGRSATVEVTAEHMHNLLTYVARGQGVMTVTHGNERFYPRPDIVYVPVSDLPAGRFAVVRRADDDRLHVVGFVEECVRAVRLSLGLIPAAVDVTGDVDVSVLAAGSGGLG